MIKSVIIIASGMAAWIAGSIFTFGIAISRAGGYQIGEILSGDAEETDERR